MRDKTRDRQNKKTAQKDAPVFNKTQKEDTGSKEAIISEEQNPLASDQANNEEPEVIDEENKEAQ